MKIPINLSSQPFRRDRAIMAASVAVSLLLAGTLSVLILLALSDRAQLAAVRSDVDRLSQLVAQAGREQAQLDAVLKKPENAQVLERSVFLNALLLRKGISWSRIFSDLEKTVPYNVRVITIHPSINGRDQVTLSMVVAAESWTPVVEMLKKLEQSPLFEHPTAKTGQQPTQGEPFYRFNVSVNYAQKL
ncbi:MAG: PilN domain-containing protein [Acidobacteriia bacterium]|nr:PilN domain-containing protein [Terriglobia bacterium]